MAGMLEGYMFGGADLYDADGNLIPRRSGLGPGQVAMPRKIAGTPYDPSPIPYASVTRKGSMPPVVGFGDDPERGDSNTSLSMPPAQGFGDTTPAGLLNNAPTTSLMGSTVGAPTGGEGDPPGWGKTVSLEGGVGPGRRAPPPDSTGYGDARGSAREAAPSGGIPEPKKMGFGDIFNKIGDMLNSRSNTLMGLGAGMLGAPSFGQGLSRGLTGAMAGGQTDIAQNRMTDTAKALVARGLPADLAAAASQSPDVMKQLLGNLLGTNKSFQHITLTDAMGNQHVVSYDTTTGKIVSAGGEGGAGTGGAPDMDRHVKNAVEHITTGKMPEGLSSDEKDVLAATSAYLEGDVMPTGNPRQKQIASLAKTVGQRVALEMNEPHRADDAAYIQRRTMRADLAKSSNSSMGGILSNGKSAFAHLANLSDNFVDLGNYGAVDDITPAWIKQGTNWTANRVIGSAGIAGKLQAIKDNSGKYGTEAQKFYSNTGGSAEERLSALHNVGGASVTGAEQAAYMRTERNLMLERLHEKENQIRETLGAGFLAKNPVSTPELEKTVARIDANIKKLEGTAPSGIKPTVTSPAAAPGGPIYKPGAIIKLDKFGNEIKT